MLTKGSNSRASGTLRPSRNTADETGAADSSRGESEKELRGVQDTHADKQILFVAANPAVEPLTGWPIGSG